MVALGEVVDCEVEAATDKDKKTVTVNGASTSTYPADGAVTYKWTAESVPVGGATGTFANNTSRTTTWTAPTTVGTYTLKCALDDPWTGTQTGVTPLETGSKNDKAADDGAPVVRSVTVYVTEIEFTENDTQKYGFDTWTNKNTDQIPWKSVGVGKTDSAIANIDPASAASGITFNSSNQSLFQMVPEPLPGTTSPQTVNLKGIAATNGNIPFPYVKVHPVGKTTDIPSYLNVAVYKQRTMRLGLAVVNRKSDDVQKIPFGSGDPTKPNQVCIEPGLDGLLDTYPNKTRDAKFLVGGDDVISGQSITTGADGICQSTASYNGFRLDKDYIYAYMNNVYNQAVIDWTVEDIPGQIVDFDQGAKDKRLDIGSTNLTWDTAEQRAIRNAFSTTTTGFHKVIFIVPYATLGYAGLSSLDQPYSFVFPSNMGSGSSAIAAHEVGHALGLEHTQELDAQGQYTGPLIDPDNIMNPIVEILPRHRLRWYQWEIVNPVADPTPIP